MTKDTSFGMAQAKAEGAAVEFTPGERRRRRAGEKRQVGNDYMELPIPKNWSRARVHKEVDEWLDRRAKGNMGW